MWSFIFITYSGIYYKFNLHLSNRSVQIKTSYSNRYYADYRVHQDSILGPLLFNTDLINVFFECDDSRIASYAHDIRVPRI